MKQPPPDMRMSRVERKLRYATYELRKLSEATTSEDLFATMDAFLSQARSVLYVLEYQFGWKGLKGRDKKRLAAQRAERERFDQWFKAAAKEVLAHPLVIERHEVVHRSGSPRFGHGSTPALAGGSRC